MEPVLLSFHAPVHELDLVGRQVVREGLSARMREWQRGSGAGELVYLATCQRVMWMFWGGDPGRLRNLESAVRFEGDAAWGHLLALSAGLESANLGDREIPDQMRDALVQAREIGTAGEEAHASLEDAIREGQRLRARLGMADGSISVATAALRHLTDALPEGASIAVVGVGPMSQYLAARLPERGFRVALCNRTLSKAEELAGELGITQVLPLSHLQRNPDGFDALVTATASPMPLFTLEAWGGLPKRAPLRILDLALPVDSEPALEQLPWVHRLDLGVFLAETATARAQRAEAALKAEPILAGAASRLRRRAEMRAKKREMRAAQDRLNDAWNGLEREALGGLSNLSDEQKIFIRDLLQRGRTLAHRALIQGGRPEEHLANVAEILQLGAS
jgi:glutamyl-tRNA reductase